MIVLKEEEFKLANGSTAIDKTSMNKTSNGTLLVPQDFDSKAWKLYPNATRFMGSDNLPLIYRFKLAKSNLIGDRNYIQFYIPENDSYRCFIYKKKQRTKEDTIDVMKNIITKLDGKTSDFIIKALEVSDSGFKEVFPEE